MLFNEIVVVFFFPLAFALTVQKQNNGETENNGKEFCFISKNICRTLQDTIHKQQKYNKQ